MENSLLIFNHYLKISFGPNVHGTAVRQRTPDKEAEPISATGYLI